MKSADKKSGKKKAAMGENLLKDKRFEALWTKKDFVRDGNSEIKPVQDRGDDTSEDEELEKKGGYDLTRQFEGRKTESSGEEEAGEEKKTQNFSSKLSKKERKVQKKRAAKDKIPTMGARVLTGGVTAASVAKMKPSKVIKKGPMSSSEMKKRTENRRLAIP